jgi:ATP-dependent Zn protease
LTSPFTNAPKAVSYSEFLAELRGGNLTEVQITEHELIGVRKADASHPKPARESTIRATRLPGVDESQLLKELDAHPVKFGGRIDQGSWFWNLLGWVLPFLFIAMIYGAGMRRIAQGSGPLTFGKNRAKIHDESSRVSIIPRSIGALGYTLQLPTQDRFLMTEPELEDQIAVLLGGRTAELLHYNGVVSTGASDDLERASALVRQMVTRFGMSDALGPLTYGRSMTAQFLQSPFDMQTRDYSERTAERIDDEARRIVDEIGKRVTGILSQRREPMERISRELIRKETLERAELDQLLETPLPVPVAAGCRDRGEVERL